MHATFVQFRLEERQDPAVVLGQSERVLHVLFLRPPWVTECIKNGRPILTGACLHGYMPVQATKEALRKDPPMFNGCEAVASPAIWHPCVVARILFGKGP